LNGILGAPKSRSQIYSTKSYPKSIRKSVAQVDISETYKQIYKQIYSTEPVDEIRGLKSKNL